MVGWDHFSSLVHRSVLRWVGHGLGWPTGLEMHLSSRFTYPQWVLWLLKTYGISPMDWFRLSQQPTRRWLRIVNTALPRARLSARQTLMVNAWRPGNPVLERKAKVPHDTAPLHCLSSSLACPACPFVAKSSKGLQVHYDSARAIQDRSLTSVGIGSCPDCGFVFVFARDR